MPSYNFKAEFRQPIRWGWKRSTMRKPRKRRTQTEERLYLFTGPRNKPERLGEAICDRVAVVDFKLDHAWLWLDGQLITSLEELDAFARRDGFSSWTALLDWFGNTYPGENHFHLDLVTWRDFVPDRLDVTEDGPVCPHAKVWLDDVEQLKCTAYCISQGWVERYKLDENGEPVLEPGYEALVRERIHGEVRATVDWSQMTDPGA